MNFDHALREIRDTHKDVMFASSLPLWARYELAYWWYIENERDMGEITVPPIFKLAMHTLKDGDDAEAGNQFRMAVVASVNDVLSRKWNELVTEELEEVGYA